MPELRTCPSCGESLADTGVHCERAAIRYATYWPTQDKFEVTETQTTEPWTGWRCGSCDTELAYDYAGTD